MRNPEFLMLLGLLCSTPLILQSSEAVSPEVEILCDEFSDEPCVSEQTDTEAEEKALERGFDPCLINSSLPACKPVDSSGDSGAPETTPSAADASEESSA